MRFRENGRADMAKEENVSDTALGNKGFHLGRVDESQLIF